MSSPPSAAAPPNLIQLLESVPPPVTLLLVELAPIISRLRWAVEVVSWKTHWTDPWLTLASWWAICLSVNTVLRYLVPFGLLIPAILPYFPFRHTTSQPSPPATEHSINLSLSDLTTLQNLLPTLPILPTTSFTTALRLSTLLFVPYLLLTYFVPMPILIGLAGTLLLTFRAPWARTARAVLWRSAFVRRFLLRIWSILTGSPSPLSSSAVSSVSHRSQSQISSASAPISAPVRFLFTVLECQRWWVGLDWTAALLPNERPSWCGVSHQPVPPPSALTLPSPTIIFLATPNGKRTRRTATWRWEDAEWGVLVNKEGTGAQRIEKTPPGLESEEGGAKIATRAASILKERKASVGSSAEMWHGKDERDGATNVNSGSEQGREGDEDLVTDGDGWVFCDNKWEGASARGGMGKYTRYRRWMRIAVLEETVEEVGPGEIGIVKEVKDRPGEDATPLERKGTMDSSRKVSDPQKHHPNGEEEGSSLRQRLKTIASTAKGTKNAS